MVICAQVISRELANSRLVDVAAHSITRVSLVASCRFSFPLERLIAIIAVPIIQQIRPLTLRSARV